MSEALGHVSSIISLNRLKMVIRYLFPSIRICRRSFGVSSTLSLEIIDDRMS